MSLVNDALKRAKEAHDKQTATPLRGAPLHTVPVKPASNAWIFVLLGFILLLVIAAGGIIYFLVLKPKTAAPPKPAIQLTIAPKPKPAAPTPAAPKPAPVAVKPAPAATPSPAELPPATQPVPVAPAAVTVAADIPPPAPPVPLKLQGILYSATKPAAVVNGRTVWVGDRINGLLVTAIAADRITVLYSNQPIVIRMP